MKWIISKRQIMGGGRIPWGYGISYYSYTQATAVCYPLPLNWLVYWVRESYFFFAQGPQEQRLKDAYQKGVEVGKTIGKQQGFQEASNGIREELDSIKKVLYPNAQR